VSDLALVAPSTSRRQSRAPQFADIARPMTNPPPGLSRATQSGMHERTKEVDALRRLAEQLREAMNNTTGPVSASAKKQSPRIKRLKRSDTVDPPASTQPDSKSPTEPPGRRWGNS
jgi:hypothetical protein